MNKVDIKGYGVGWIKITEIIDTDQSAFVPAIFKGGKVTYGRSEFSVDIEDTTVIAYKDKKGELVDFELPLGRNGHPVNLLNYHNVEMTRSLRKARKLIRDAER